MSDARRRALERLAVGGDEEAEVSLYQDRVRARERGPLPCPDCEGHGNLGTGGLNGRRMDVPEWTCEVCEGTGLSLFAKALGLAAYCGHAPARKAMPYRDVGGAPGSWLCVDGWALERWLRGLGRWGRRARERTSVAAARKAFDVIAARRKAAWRRGHLQDESLSEARRALEAAEEHRDRPSEESEESCAEAIDHFFGGAGTMPRWAYAACWLAAWPVDQERRGEETLRERVLLGQGVLLAVEDAGEDAVLGAIRADLIGWALGGDFAVPQTS